MSTTTMDSESVRVRELMTGDPITVETDVTVERVLAIMKEAHIRHVPVVDDSGLVGVVSDRDLTFIHGLPGVLDEVEDDDVQKVLDAPISLVLKSRFLVDRDVVTLHRDEQLQEAVDIFVGSKIGAVPVVDRDDEVVGILSAVDVLRWVGDEVLV